MKMPSLSRRNLLKALAACTASAAALGGSTPARSGQKKPKFLVVCAGLGGASIIDSFLSIRESECPNYLDVNCFPDAEVIDIPGSKLRAVDLSRSKIGAIPAPFTAHQSDFVNKHKQDMMVVTTQGTSVNHVIAQKRSVTGNGAWDGRTLQECVANEYGKGYTLPNVNMASLGYIERGDDPTLPAYGYSEPVAQPVLWPFSLDGMRGLKGAPDRPLVDMARSLRNDKLDPETSFYQTFQLSEGLQRWRQQRTAALDIEAADLITKLNPFTDQPPQIPLTEFGLGSSPDAALVQATFPNFISDPLEAQAAMAFLLLKYGVSVTVTLSPAFGLVIDGADVANPPLAFDFSHQAHRAAQAVMWKRVLGVCDRLIDLLKSEEFDATTGESFWDRTMIYVPTDFGRSKGRQNGADDFGTGHDLNNGVLVVSPLCNGNTVLGNVDKSTGLTYGFDPVTGQEVKNKTTTEKEVFAGILQALDVDTTGAGLPDMPKMRKGG